MADDSRDEEVSESDQGSCRRCDRNYQFNLKCEIANVVIRMATRLVKLVTVTLAVAFATRRSLDTLGLFWLVSFLVYAALHEVVILFAKDIVTLKYGLASSKDDAGPTKGCHPRNRCLRVSEWVLCLAIIATGLCFIAFAVTIPEASAPSMRTKAPTQTSKSINATSPKPPTLLMNSSTHWTTSPLAMNSTTLP